MDTKKGFYKIDNIPFYASAALDDVVHAEYDDAQERLFYKETVEYSGTSTIQVVIESRPDRKKLREIWAFFVFGQAGKHAWLIQGRNHLIF